MQAPIFEILTWRSATSVADDEMINTMAQFGEVVKGLPGFIHQSLYKNADDQWVCIYFWQREEDAHGSNQAVANLPIFGELMSLIKKDSITMEVLSALQSNSGVSFPLQV
ncbi:MAG: hypothetical protein ACRBCI_14800 [Cellvibrionaceae bacterium]